MQLLVSSLVECLLKVVEEAESYDWVRERIPRLQCCRALVTYDALEEEGQTDL